MGTLHVFGVPKLSAVIRLWSSVAVRQRACSMKMAEFSGFFVQALLAKHRYEAYLPPQRSKNA
jgi:hypothetical protein